MKFLDQAAIWVSGLATSGAAVFDTGNATPELWRRRETDISYSVTTDVMAV